MYKYIFYKFYRFWEAISNPRFLSDWKAEISILFLEISLFLSFVVYYKVFTNEELLPNGLASPVVYLFLGLTLLIKIVLFNVNDRWKSVIVEFDKLPKEKNKTGSWVVSILVILIIGNLMFSFYLLSKK